MTDQENTIESLYCDEEMPDHLEPALVQAPIPDLDHDALLEMIVGLLRLGFSLDNMLPSIRVLYPYYDPFPHIVLLALDTA